MKRFHFFYASSGVPNAGNAYISSLNPLAWFDPSYNLTDNGSTVRWDSRTGGYSLTSQGTKPSISTLAGTSATVLNVSNSLMLDSTSSLGNALASSAPYTAYYVARGGFVGGQAKYVWGIGSPSTTNYFTHGLTNAGLHLSARIGLSFAGNMNIGTGSFIDSVAYDGTNLTAWSNGTTIITQSAFVADITPANHRFGIGARYRQNIQALDFFGDIGDVIVFTGSHSDATRRQVERELATKYNFSIVDGYSNFSSTNYLSASSQNVLSGSSSGFWVACLIRIETQDVTSATRTIACHESASPNAGWVIQSLLTNSTLRFVAFNGAGSNVNSPSYTITASDIGKVLLVVGVHDGSTVRLYVSAVQVGSGTAIVGYNTPVGSSVRVGRRSVTTEPASNITIFGIAGGQSVPNSTQIQQYYSAVKAAKQLVAMPEVQTDKIWNMTSTVGNVAESVSGISSETMTMVGTLSASHAIVSVWQ